MDCMVEFIHLWIFAAKLAEEWVTVNVLIKNKHVSHPGFGKTGGCWASYFLFEKYHEIPYLIHYLPFSVCRRIKRSQLVALCP